MSSHLEKQYPEALNSTLNPLVLLSVPFPRANTSKEKPLTWWFHLHLLLKELPSNVYSYQSNEHGKTNQSPNCQHVLKVCFGFLMIF